MSTPGRSSDAIIDTYLRDVERALIGLPSLQKDELLADLSAHIESARETVSEDSEAEVRQILDRLGSPETVAAAARGDEPVPASPRHRWLNRRVAVVIGVGIAIVMAVALIFLLLLISSSSSMSRIEAGGFDWGQKSCL